MPANLAPGQKINVARLGARYAEMRSRMPKKTYDNAAAQQVLLETISATSETRERANELLGVDSIQAAAAPSEAPTETPSEVEAPNVWNMPVTGSQHCDCGEDHELDLDWLMDCAEENAEDPEWMTHKEVIEAAKMFWNYESVCEFFRMAINTSAIAINGQPAEKYKFSTGMEIVLHFSKTWNGCPEEGCEGDD
jgi:hypothetical protein